MSGGEIPNMERTVDLCVIGASGSGLSCAVKAAQLGVKNILILEKMPAIGGCTKMAGGIFGIDTPVQKRKGAYYSADQAFKDVITVLNWNVDAKLVRKWISGTGENIRWLEEMGMVFEDVFPFTGDPSKFRHTYHTGKRNGAVLPQTGLQITKVLKAKCDEYGIEILTRTRARHLIKEDGKVTGVIAEGRDGEELVVHAKAVAMGTGSISANKELLKRFYNTSDYGNVAIMANVPHNTGDGVIMGEEIGAQIGKISTLFIGPHNHFPGASEVVGALMRRPQVISVNKSGERFVDESLVVSSEFGWMKSVNLDRQPGKISWAILDKAALDWMIQNPKKYHCVDGGQVNDEGTNENFGVGDSSLDRNDPYAWLTVAEAHLYREQASGRVKVCQTVEEMAEYIGCDPAVLQKTIDDYNEACHIGYDKEFLKDPAYMMPVSTAPYFVMLAPSGIDTCIGGLAVDNHQRILDQNSDPIPGLYGMGVLTSGWLAGVYAFFGSEMSYTIFSGRNAAAEIAALLK
jgi:fumarate reductase flavoprotein subunit